MTKLKGTIVLKQTLDAIDRFMVYATLKDETDTHYNVDLYVEVEEEGQTYYKFAFSRLLDKKTYLYEVFNAKNDVYKGCISYSSQECELIQSISIRRYKYIIHKGSSRSSKTHSVLQAHYIQACRNNWRIALWRDTKKSCKDTLLEDFKKIVPTFGDPIPRLYLTESYYQFNTGSKIEFNGTENHLVVHGYQGDVAHFNEPYNIPKSVFDQIDMRTRQYCIIDYNPVGKHWVDDVMKDDRAIVIHSTYKNNPFCPAEQKTKIEGYQPLKWFSLIKSSKMTINEAENYDFDNNPLKLSNTTLSELARCLYNEKRGTADEYMHMVYALGEKAERPNKIYKFKRCTYSEFLRIDAPIWYGIDWGKVDPFAIAEFKYFDGAIYANELHYLSENEVKSKISPLELEIINRTEQGIVNYVINKIGIDKEAFIVCDNNYPEKVKELRRMGYINAMTADKGSGSIVEGIRLVSNLEVFVTDRSKNMIIEEENYEYQTDKYSTKLEKPVENGGFDHLMDVLRYVASKKRRLGIIRHL